MPEGKRIYIASIGYKNSKLKYPAKVVILATKRTSKADGQIFLVTEYEIQNFNILLMDVIGETIIKFYKDMVQMNSFTMR